MSILNHISKVKRYRKTDAGYALQSQWTSAETVEMNDGSTLEESLGSIYNRLNGLSFVLCTQAEYDALEENEKETPGRIFIIKKES